MKKHSILIVSLFFALQSVSALADNLYQCRQSNGQINFTDKPCDQHKHEHQESHRALRPAPRVQTVAPPLDEQLNGGTVSHAIYMVRPDNPCQRVNAMEINKKYEIKAFEAKADLQRENEKEQLRQRLAWLEIQRKYELQGCY